MTSVEEQNEAKRIEMFAEAKKLRPDAYWAQTEFVRSVAGFASGKDSLAMATFCRVFEAYKEPLLAAPLTPYRDRAYHNFGHVLDLLGWWRMNLFNENSIARSISFFAIIYHDCKYFIDGSKRSESASAAIAVPELFSLGIDHDTVSLVVREILTTEHSQDRDSHYFVRDYDLVGLARDWDEVAEDTKKIRLEYSDASDEEFYRGRKKFFEGFRTRRIFNSGIFQYTFSHKARQNMEKIIEDCDQKLLTVAR